jgi:hypothetical protein
MCFGFGKELNLQWRLVITGASNMSLSELLPDVNQLSRQDKLRLIHFLLLAVANEEGCHLESPGESEPANVLLNQLASTEAVVWSPQTDSASVQALSDLLVAAREASSD